jgi:hypothetical protein
MFRQVWGADHIGVLFEARKSHQLVPFQTQVLSMTISFISGAPHQDEFGAGFALHSKSNGPLKQKAMHRATTSAVSVRL